MIPLADPARYAVSKREELHSFLDQMLDRRQFVLGDMVTDFESLFASFVGTKHCVSLASGTDALEIALRALGCEEKEVLLVANAGGYGTISCLAISATPVFCDIDPSTLLISTASIMQNVTPKTGAIIVTHLFGLAVDCAKIHEAVKTKLGFSVPIIEDCAQAHGAKIGDQRAGSQVTIGCFSFYPTKNLGALGDGGAITTNDDNLAMRILQLRQYGWSDRYFQSAHGGRNSRLDELQAGFLAFFLHDLDQRNKIRRAIVMKYSESGASTVHGSFVGTEKYVAHLAVCLVKERDLMMSNFAEAGITTGVHYPFLDTEFQTTRHLKSAVIPNSVIARDKIVTIPCFPEMTTQEIDQVCRVIAKFKRYFEA